VRLPRLRMGTLSGTFYNNLYSVAPGTLKRDTRGLSAVCLLPPKVKVDRPFTAHPATRRETPSGPPYGRTGITKEVVRPHTATPARGGAALPGVNPEENTAKARKRTQRPKTATVGQKSGRPGGGMTPYGTMIDSRPSTADSFTKKVDKYRAEPVSKSRKCWNRINPGHMLERWDSTNRAVQNPKFDGDEYRMAKEFHLPKTDIMTYVNDMIRMRVSIKTGFR